MKSIIAAVVLLSACKGETKPAEPPPAKAPKSDSPVEESKAGVNPTPPSVNDDGLATYEAKTGKQFSGVLIARDGAWVQRKKVGTVEDLIYKPKVLTNAIMETDKHESTTVVFELNDDRSAGVEASLRQIGAAGRGMVTYRRGDSTEGCKAIVALSKFDSTTVNLSVTVLTDTVFLGISRVNEFIEVSLADKPDEKLAKAFNEQKSSMFFSDRNDIEIAASPEAKASAYLAAFHAACSAGFTSIAVISASELSAKVSL